MLARAAVVRVDEIGAPPVAVLPHGCTPSTQEDAVRGTRPHPPSRPAPAPPPAPRLALRPLVHAPVRYVRPGPGGDVLRPHLGICSKLYRITLTDGSVQLIEAACWDTAYGCAVTMYGTVRIDSVSGW